MAAAISQPVRMPAWSLTYLGTNITKDVTEQIISITYTEELGQHAGSLEIELQDRDKRWQGPWFLQQGDVVNLLIGYVGEASLPCGLFQVDELELVGPPDVFHLRCIPTYITPKLRTKQSIGYENQTLTQIAQTIAAKHGFTVLGAPNAVNVLYQRVTQAHETDLAFLHRIAREHDYDFTIRGTQLQFYARPALEQQAPSLTILRSTVDKFSFKTKAHQIYGSAQASYFDPTTKQLFTSTVQANPKVAMGDTLKVIQRVENAQQAAEVAASALHEKNRLLVTTELSAPGSNQLRAGAVVALSGWGVMDGNYLIEQGQHHLTRAGGYTTQIKARKT